MNGEPMLRARAASITLGVGLLAALALGGWAGVRLGERASRASSRELEVVDPAALPSGTGAEARSVGGFSGFGGPPALQGAVLRHGAASEVAPGTLALVDGAATTTVEYTQPLRLYRIAPSSAPPAVGDMVVVNVDGAHATGVLLTRLSAPAGAAR